MTPVDVFEFTRVPIGIRRQAERLNRADSHLAEAQGVVGVCAEQEQTIPRHQADQTPEGESDLVERRVDICVIELDVVHHGDFWQVLEKLRGLVEIRAVVLVSLDNEVTTLPNPITRPAVAEIPRDSAHEDRRV